MSPGICLHVKIPPKLQILFYEQLPAQDLDFHIFSNNMIIANKWLISPQSLKIFIFVCFLTTLHVQLATGMKTWRATYCGNPEGEITLIGKL